MSMEMDRMTKAIVSEILVGKMGAKLVELMGEDAFDDWLVPVSEEVAIKAREEVSRAKRIEDVWTGPVPWTEGENGD